jgi:hypothetical protein
VGKNKRIGMPLSQVLQTCYQVLGRRKKTRVQENYQLRAAHFRPSSACPDEDTNSERLIPKGAQPVQVEEPGVCAQLVPGIIKALFPYSTIRKTGGGQVVLLESVNGRKNT